MIFGSLFSGIGGFDLGFERAGMTCAWQVEIDAKCRDVLNRHWPDVPKYEDVRNVGRNLEPVDLICGGFPCQDLSVAGQRKGLAGERSGLWFEFHRVLAELRPGWVVIENVPGLLSGCGCTTCQAVGRIIRIHTWLRKREGGVECPICIAGKRMLKAHSGRNFTILLRGLVELGYGVCWRVLDAQFFGVAQRRRRVFIVGYLGDGRAAQVLFERESSAWDSAPSREAGQELARDVAASLRSRGDGSGTRQDNETGLTICSTFNGYTGGADDNDAQGGHLVRAIRSVDRGNSNLGRDVGRMGYSIPARRLSDGIRTQRLGTSMPGNISSMIGYRMTAFGQYADDGTSSALKERDYKDATDLCVQLSGESQDVVQITSGGGKPGQGYPCVAQLSPCLGKESYSPTKSSSGQMVDFCIGSQYGVRRLTPTECERLQGFPDGHTEGQSDSARYRQLGNAVCVSNAEWLGERIVRLF